MSNSTDANFRLKAFETPFYFILLLGCLGRTQFKNGLGFSFWHKSDSGVFSACARYKSMHGIGQQTSAEYTLRSSKRLEAIREIKQRRFWTTHVNRKWAFSSFNKPWRYRIYIAKCLNSYRDDLPKNLFKSRLKSAKRPFPVDVRRSKTSLLKLPISNLSSVEA